METDREKFLSNIFIECMKELENATEEELNEIFMVEPTPEQPD